MSDPGTSDLPTRRRDERSGGADSADAPGETRPRDSPLLFSVVKGAPTAEELAVLVAVLVAVLAARRASSAGAVIPAARRSGWSARERGLRGMHRAGPGGWRASALPRLRCG